MQRLNEKAPRATVGPSGLGGRGCSLSGSDDSTVLRGASNCGGAV